MIALLLKWSVLTCKPHCLTAIVIVGVGRNSGKKFDGLRSMSVVYQRFFFFFLLDYYHSSTILIWLLSFIRLFDYYHSSNITLQYLTTVRFYCKLLTPTVGLDLRRKQSPRVPWPRETTPVFPTRGPIKKKIQPTPEVKLMLHLTISKL